MRPGLAAYFIACTVVAWSLWLASRGIADPGLRGLVFLAGTFAPGLLAIGFTARSGGREAVRALLGRLVAVNVPARWYLFALLFMMTTKLSAAVLLRATTGEWPRFGATPWYLMLAAAVGTTMVGSQAGEELGWRGYALPRLTARFGLARAGVLLGVLWAAWHLPLFFLPEADTHRQSFPLYLIQVTALSVTFAWLHARTGGSLVPVMLLHAAVNNTKDIVPSAELVPSGVWALSRSPVAWLTAALLWGFAAVVLARMRGAGARGMDSRGRQA